MSYVYRCNKCRTRNTFRKPWLDYVHGRKCRHCNHDRFYVDKERIARLTCQCRGYHYPHRPGSGACEHSATWAIHMARRGGDPKEIAAAIIEAALERPGIPSTVCPF